ncbi:MAG: hypothetical protein LJE66_07120 [Desulfobacterales bacterium]|nr:hypothetical protein [Desulfobacterales bacterium]
MYAGQVIETGAREEVFAVPIHPYTKSLLASYLTLDGKKASPIPNSGNTADRILSSQGCRFCDRCPVSNPECSRTEPQWVEISPTHKVLCDKC